MASNLYTVDMSMNINTGCFVCEDKEFHKAHGLCCDLVAALQSDFLKYLPLYSGRYDTGEQKTLVDIVIKNVVTMLHERTELDDKNPISRYQFCQLNNNDLRIVADMSVSNFRKFSKTNMIMNKNEIQNRQKEIVDTLKQLRTGFNMQARRSREAAHKRSLDFLRNISLTKSYTVCFE